MPSQAGAAAAERDAGASGKHLALAPPAQGAERADPLHRPNVQHLARGHPDAGEPRQPLPAGHALLRRARGSVSPPGRARHDRRPLAQALQCQGDGVWAGTHATRHVRSRTGRLQQLPDAGIRRQLPGGHEEGRDLPLGGQLGAVCPPAEPVGPGGRVCSRDRPFRDAARVAVEAWRLAAAARVSLPKGAVRGDAGAQVCHRASRSSSWIGRGGGHGSPAGRAAGAAPLVGAAAGRCAGARRPALPLPAAG
mmetsp:Transcript_6400/g.25866  ORF Transcript_6400/g.25866 Transcript_6400/m.25866 type:complete len:251 (+) Transcript_6400:8598-9350(+)